MIHTEYLIVGGGIAGTLLSYELLCAGKSVYLVNDEKPQAASLVAAALLNP
ncbi:MAG: FAD-binding oxidoreductase, partial [Chitinophagaceae bacterium]|nr:FAD-binding oxidoreductase [Chitinophagaceae bacterium]